MAKGPRGKGSGVDSRRKAKSVPDRRNEGSVSHPLQVGSRVCRENGLEPRRVMSKPRQRMVQRIRRILFGDPKKIGPSVGRISGRLSVAIVHLSRPDMGEAAAEEVAKSVRDLVSLAAELEALAFDLSSASRAWNDESSEETEVQQGESSAT